MFTVEHECAQCGARIELLETDRVLACDFCGVRSYLATDDRPRLALGASAATANDVLWVPYLRFKGALFLAQRTGVAHRVVDVSRRALKWDALPESLGLRSQTQAIRFLRPDLAGRFLRPDDERAEVLGPGAPAPAFLRVYVGEVTSVIYVPLVMSGRDVRDGITGAALARLPPDADPFAGTAEIRPDAQLTLLPALCPGCGSALDGEGASAVLTCANCERAWEPAGARFVERSVVTLPARRARCVHLPFWRMEPRTEGMGLDSVADFERFTNQRVLTRERDAPLVFWCPAFKVAPQLLLRLATRLTLAQPSRDATPAPPPRARYPATLALREAEKMMAITLADLTMHKEQGIPRLGDVRIAAAAATLAYLPFEEAGTEVVNADWQIGVSRGALAFARSL